MKIATLTLHLPFNYGNALQMLSLHRYLLEQGYDAEVISRWDLKNRAEIKRIHNEIRRPLGLVKFILRCLLCMGEFCALVRECKILRWLSKNIKWSDATGYGNCFDADDLPHDIVIVGSDQVWNLKYEAIRFFFLRNFPERIKKISYAASMGGDSFPDCERQFVRESLARFSAVSVRESSAAELLGKFGVSATLVCDPTLLHSRQEWDAILGLKKHKVANENAPYMVYLVSPSAGDKWREVIRLARESRRRVHVYAFWAAVAPIEKGHRLAGLWYNLRRRVLLYCAGVRLHFSATPTEFVQRVADCGGLFTDSFHGMMFATIYQKKCNVVVGTDPERVQMSARLRNFAEQFGDERIITPSFDLSALRALTISSNLQNLISDSKVWLKTAIEGCAHG